MKELFKSQLTNNQVVTEQNLEKLKKPHYFNGEEIKVGDRYLLALVVNGSVDNPFMAIELVMINENHIDLYEQDTEYNSNENFPIIKTK